ncbi:MAG: hypothetical protein ACREJT_03775, partial [Myxococcota bacterium]
MSAGTVCVALCAALVCEACAPKAPSPELLAVQAVARSSGLPLSFWPGPGAATNPEYASGIREQPCGRSLTAHVARIPPLDNLELEPDRVYELGPNEEVTREWAVPIDDTLAG